MQPFYSVNEFLIFKNNLYTVQENFIVFCVVEILYILNISYILCVHGFFTFYCHIDKLLDPWNVLMQAFEAH